MKVISEDNRRKSKTSVLYDVVYGADCTSFTMGSGNIEKRIDDFLKGGISEIVAYVDVVPENEHTARLLYDLYDKYRNISKVHIVPIICSEHCLLVSMREMGCNLNNMVLGILMGSIDYKNTPYKDLYSLEKVCKEIARDESLIGVSIDKYLADSENGLELKGVSFITNHTAFLPSKSITRYHRITEITNDEALELFLGLYDKICFTKGITKQSEHIRLLKQMIGYKE